MPPNPLPETAPGSAARASDHLRRWLFADAGEHASGERIAVFVDLPPTTTLPIAAPLSRAGYVVVPIIQRWVSSPAVLPCDQLVAQLVGCADLIRRPECSNGVVFLLDGDRVSPDRSAARRSSPRTFDNRYEYPVCRFPPPSFLRRDGVARIVWVSTRGIAEDLRPYVAELSAAGYRVTTRRYRRRSIDSISPF